MFDHYSTNRRRGDRWQHIGTLLLLAGMFIFRVAMGDPDNDKTQAMIKVLPTRWMALTLLLLAVGSFLVYRGRQYAALYASEIATAINRPPVVYLRPFTADSSRPSYLARAVSFLLVGLGNAATAPTDGQAVDTVFEDQEEQLASATEPIGPLQAIGRPGELLPKPGAIRAYANGDEWRSIVDHWLTVARLVIVHPGRTPGVQWEMHRAFSIVPPDKLLLLMRGIGEETYHGLSRLLQVQVGAVLPPFATIAGPYYSVSGFFEFDEQWHANFLPFQKSFKETLRPVLTRLGVQPWDEPLPAELPNPNYTHIPGARWRSISFAIGGVIAFLLFFAVWDWYH